MNEKIDWEYFKSIPCWTPLASVRLNKKVKVGESLYRIGSNVYMYAHHSILIETKAKGPYVTLLLWAESDGAANRAMNRDIEHDEKNIKADPPQEMLYKECLMYGELVRCLKKDDKYEPYTETATYRLMKGKKLDGAFVSTSIRVDDWEFKFRSLRGRKSETPFAIQYRLHDNARS